MLQKSYNIDKTLFQEYYNGIKMFYKCFSDWLKNNVQEPSLTTEYGIGIGIGIGWVQC